MADLAIDEEGAEDQHELYHGDLHEVFKDTKLT
jgi:hypothetical protein